MGIKRCLAAILAVAVTLSCIMVPGLTFAAEETTADYGRIATNASATVLYFGADSLTTGGGEIKEDTVTLSTGTLTTNRTENLKAKDGGALLTLSSIDLNGKGYDKVELCVADKNDTAAVIKVGETEVATFANINTGAWDVYTSPLKADLTAAAATASGNVTINLTGSGYCGNFIYIKFYNSSAADAGLLPTPTPEPIDPSTILPYQNTELSFEERAADLVSRMTLEEKVAQLGKDAPAIDRLGVSKYGYWKECLHGVARQGVATSFPTSLALSNTWNRDLFYDVAWVTSDEARAKNNRYNLSYYTPTINMARDPRWGRNEETYGEDPYLTGQLGTEFVRGMEGEDEKYKKIIATIKHFAANNNEQSRRGGSSVMTEFNLRNYYTKVFQNVTEAVKPGSAMASYNATTIYRNGELLYNFTPSAANQYLLTDLLRRNWGFDGYVTTDCGTGEDLVKTPNYKAGSVGDTSLPSEAYIADALKAGMDLECNLGGGNMTQTYGVAAVNNGYITEEEVETNVYHLFLQRFKTGEFDDNATTYRDRTSSIIESDEHVALAEKVAEETWVLLKNDNILPLKSDVKNIAIVGDFAGQVFLGDYSGEPTKTKTPYEGLKEELAVTHPEATLSYLGAVPEDSEIMNVKSLTVVYADGKTSKIDLSKAENVSGMTLSNGTFVGVTPNATAVLKKVNLENAVSIKAEMSTNAGSLGGAIVFNYETANGPQVASVVGESTGSTDTYVEYSGAYTGSDGGYGGADATLYFSITPNTKTFSVDNFKSQLDAADVIIAYAGTNLSDSSESNDRETITLPNHESHVKAITEAYPDKTVVAMSTVGQIDVEPFMNNSKAILWNSYNGQTQGTAFGKVLTGQVNPSGKLTTTWYKNADLKKMSLIGGSKKIGDITGIYTDYDLQPTDTMLGRTYQYYEGTPVYPFGYGLSYTNFEYSNMTVDKTAVDANGELTVSIDVTNTGAVAGKEIVQLYISHPQESMGNAGDGETTLSYANGTVTINSAIDKNAKLIVSPSNKTKDIQITDVALKANEATTATLTVEAGDKIMLWSSLEEMTPLANALVVGSDAVTATVAAEQMDSTANPANDAFMADSLIPNKQLKEFTKVELAPGETKTVTFKLDVKDFNLFSELQQKLCVLNGTYRIMVGKNANDTTNMKTVDVTGTLESTLKTVKAMPNGISVNGLIQEDGQGLESVTTIDSGLSAIMSDEVWADLTSNAVTVKYTSANTDVATVDANGIVSSGSVEGVTTITAEVTVDGVTLSDSFPVVNKLKIKPTAEDVTNAKATFEAEFNKLPKVAYSAANWAEIQKIYNDTIANFDVISTKDDLSIALAKAINDLNSVEMDALTEAYSIVSENANYIKNGMIDYAEGGIPVFDGAIGTVTNDAPFTGIQLQAKDAEGNVIDNSKIVWQIKKFDDSVRKVAEVDSKTGILTVYGNGIVQLTAANVEDMTCGRLMVQINMQIEAEYADNGNGAMLADVQGSPSGGFNAGSTGDTWIEYKSVKLSNLESIDVRYAGKNAGTINISLDKNVHPGNVVASGTPNATGAWGTWATAELTLDQEALDAAFLAGKLDEYGCATIYVQTNGVNLDYIRMNYIENNDEVPYIIEKALNKTESVIKTTLKYRGSKLATEVKLVAEVLNADGTTKSTVETAVKGKGEYEITTGAAAGETVRLTICDNEGKPLSESKEVVWNEPVDSKIVVYSLSPSYSDGFDYSVLSGGTDSTAYTDTVNGLSGYGSWKIANKSAALTYLDVNEKPHAYSFTRGWQAGKGGTANRCLYFTPTSECNVTVVFMGAKGRDMYIQQGDNTVTGIGVDGQMTVFNMETSDTTAPVYVYGGSSNKQLLAIIVEYYGMGEAATDEARQAK